MESVCRAQAEDRTQWRLTEVGHNKLKWQRTKPQAVEMDQYVHQ